jgi:hypothetical protein
MLLMGWTILYLEDMTHVTDGLDYIVPGGYDPCC